MVRTPNGAPGLDERPAPYTTQARAVSPSRREGELEEEEDNISSSSSSRERTKRCAGCAPNGALAEVAADLAAIDPSKLPWPDLCPTIARTAARVRNRNCDRMDPSARKLVVAVAIAAHQVPELEEDWLDRAADAAPKAKTNRKDYFRAVLGEGLEFAGLCETHTRFWAVDQIPPGLQPGDRLVRSIRRPGPGTHQQAQTPSAAKPPPIAA